MQAAGGNDADLVHALVSAGADVDAMSNIGHTPLTYACACGSISAVVALIHENADITIKDYSTETNGASACKCWETYRDCVTAL